MKTFDVTLTVETDDSEAYGGFIEKVLEGAFDSYDGYGVRYVDATLVETDE